ncbi:extracellular solute-binding protein family 1 [Kribbella flavida DSM 17836]|uniref:Extracellular solute-binding protein family 1 n=1 Tax=Kribbella flavida (strain DSM 17836 / JCM 10339 / NBRC 14399) TaxID=479435 RepID=D2PV03_KRIFD|nr:ABC transporter substrate-binding protein [Kribbella flavida]ADB31469.1 extracellular solute-binding protein family 1 [Kribbella flavida DSM 17836]
MSFPTGNVLSRRSLLRGLGAAGVGAGLGGLATGCGGSVLRSAAADLPPATGAYDGPPVTLRFWNGLTGGDGPFMRKLLARFQELNPAVTIEMYAIPWSNFYQKFPASVASGLAPDFALMHNFQVATNAARGVIMPVDSLVDAVGLSEQEYPATVWQSGVYQDRRYSIPLDIWPDSLFYNRRVLAKAGLDPDQPPQDAAAYLAALETLRSKGIAGHWLASVDPQGVGRPFDSLLWQHGGTHYDADGTTAYFTSAAATAALEWQVSLLEQGFSPRNASGGDANVAFKNDKNAFLWGGPGALINDLSKVKNLDWGVAPLPRIGSQRAAFSGSHQFVIARQKDFDPDRVAASVAFISWLTRNAAGWAEAGPIPARRSVQQSGDFQKLVPQAKVARGVDFIKFYPLIPGIADVQLTILYPAVSDVLLQNSTPERAMEDAVAQASELLQENRQKYEGSR